MIRFEGWIDVISEGSIKQISQVFCGDIEGYYSYKSGPKLVGFFNQYFLRFVLSGKILPLKPIGTKREAVSKGNFSFGSFN